MALAPALDLRDDDREAHPPSNIDAEQGLLGAILYDNDAFHQVECDLRPHHFYEPFHARLYAFLTSKVAKGVLAEPIMVMDQFRADPALQELGGLRYLADLVDRAPPAANADGIARVIVESAACRELVHLADNLGRAARGRDPEVHTSDEMLARVETTVLQLRGQGSEAKPMTVAEASRKVLERIDNPEAMKDSIQTGLGPLDKLLGPLLPGDLVLFMGRPSMGKSAAAECVSVNVADPGIGFRMKPDVGHLADHDFPKQFRPEPVGVLQLNGEMSEEMMTMRHLSDLCHHGWGHRGPKYSAMRSGEVSKDHRDMLTKADEALGAMPLVMLKRPSFTISKVRSLARQAALDFKRRGMRLGLVVVDHGLHVWPDDGWRDIREAQTKVSGAMKALADDLQCVVVVLNQMSRQNESREDKRPRLEDLRESGSWEQDADFVIGWYREAYYAQREAEPKAGMPGSDADAKWSTWDKRRKSKTVEAIVLKARMGAIGTAELWGDVTRNAIRGAEPASGDLI